MIYKYKQRLSSEYWRNCGESNLNYLHVLYLCKILNTYCLDVFKFVEEVLKTTLCLKAENIILGKPPTGLSEDENDLFKNPEKHSTEANNKGVVKKQTPRFNKMEKHDSRSAIYGESDSQNQEYGSISEGQSPACPLLSK